MECKNAVKWLQRGNMRRGKQFIYQKIRDLKFRNKVMLLTVAAGLLPVLLISAYMQGRMSRLLRTREINTLNRSLQQAVETLDNKANIYENLINYLSYSKELRAVLESEKQSDFKTYKQYADVADPLLEMPRFYHKEIKEITLYADSIAVAHGTTLIPLYQAVDEPWYKEVDSQEQLLSWYVQGGVQKEIVTARKFYSDDDVRAILALRLDYDELIDSLASLVRDETGLLITDEKNNVVYSSYSIKGVDTPEKPEDTAYIKGKYAWVQEKVDSTGWSCLLYRPEGVVTVAANRLSLGNIPIIVSSVAILILIGVYFSKKTVAPLERLTENMNKVHMGMRQVTVHSDSKDEVGVLIRSFARMMDQINHLITEVYEGKIQLAHTEMKALQAQINPHFLYNSLSIINWKALEAGEEEISKVTLALSTYYRTSLNRGELMTTVEKEIQNIRAYLHIQLVMHDREFVVSEELDESLFSYEVPKLMLQPLAENAIDHGLDLSEKEEKRLMIRLFEKDEKICFEIEDNGVGMPQKKAEEILTYRSHGYGMRNVAQRIRLTYREEGGIKVSSEEGKGTKVTILLPKYPPREEMEVQA